MMSTNVSEVSGSGVTIFIHNSKAKNPPDSTSYIRIDFQRNETHSEITMKIKSQHVFTVAKENNQTLNTTDSTETDSTETDSTETDSTETFKRYKAEYWFLPLNTDNSSCSVELEAGFRLTSELEVVFNFTQNFTFFNENGSCDRCCRCRKINYQA
ncbi:uncharacterized protein LOC111716359 isoform X4 [Eurytemora carolleeae]|uniref:uncharacterized protein LOC111716359 isoform X4 n=1 Tax=Eurytemora carolleeae TaxID=1294199 RepID=UPI000C757BE3|nr:uncharacterized protein LOC111716359 isoform X4 [Eurytemora carolleeae]|eukprot:XP_023347568.1 uncharacterized protein LOC111716359 isoform X4 [Eurytemora affinis]